MEEKVDAQGTQVARHVHDELVEDPRIASYHFILLLQLLDQLEIAGQIYSKKTSAVSDLEKELFCEVLELSLVRCIKDLSIEHLVEVGDYGPAESFNLAPRVLLNGLFNKLARFSRLEKSWHFFRRCLLQIGPQGEVNDLGDWCLLEILLHHGLSPGVVHAGDRIQDRLVCRDKLIEREYIFGES